MDVNQDDQNKADNDFRISDEWLKTLHSQVGREVSTARQSQQGTHNWVIVIITGALAAIWALGNGEFDYPTETSIIAVLAMLPLVFRFFVRSCLEYQIFNRWLTIRNALDIFYFTSDQDSDMKSRAKQNLVESIRLYYFQWKQPKSTQKMVLDNLQLAYGWPFILLLAMLIWGAVAQVMTKAISIAIVIVALWMAFELLNFVRYFSCKYAVPTVKIDPKTV